MPTRFVILHHSLPGGEHWDLMLEHGDVLLTWQLQRDPTGPATFPIPARRIGDHRKAYLEYEGPVSKDRGTVRRVDTGTVELQQITEAKYDLVLRGRHLSGSMTLTATGSDWVLERGPG